MSKYAEIIKSLPVMKTQAEESANYSGCKILDAVTIEKRFNKDDLPDQYEVMIVCGVTFGEEKKIAKVYLGLSSDVIQNGEGKTWAENSFDQLEKLGIPCGGTDLEKLESLIDKEINLYGRLKDGYLNFYISNAKPEEVDPAKVAALFKKKSDPVKTDEFTNSEIPF